MRFNPSKTIDLLLLLVAYFYYFDCVANGVAAADSDDSFEVIELTTENYDLLTSGKTVFIHFYVPWCQVCRRIAPAWKKLAEEYEGHDIGLVAEVNCAGDKRGGDSFDLEQRNNNKSKRLCDWNGVQNYPAIKWGDPTRLEDYPDGDRGYWALEAFAKDHLTTPVCSPENLDLCDEDRKEQLEEYMNMSTEDLESMIDAIENKLTAAEESFNNNEKRLRDEYELLSRDHHLTINQGGESSEKAFENAEKKVHEEFEKLSEEKDKKYAAAKDSGFALMKAVSAFKAKTSREEL